MPNSPLQETLRRCVHLGSDVTLSTEGDELRDTEQLLRIKRLEHSGTQTPREISRFNLEPYGVSEKYDLGTDEESKSEIESELRHVKEQLKGAEIYIAYLLERVATYRHRWLEDYHRAENLERCMPDFVYVPHLDQIPPNAPSPTFGPELFSWEDEGSEPKA
ncbi:uncharacterized protein F5891DRAFT_985467 [Suillus fuscotomentosus]|uniref:Uncharacterized protein n=1 Tax=Suillus fuscotomentosus TaxID=1912939 RepID=A0AAD4HF25_9AGAM|nr:uncharacterized protein F5891DRAFT_985467 [Suillus fuscotomentosus]KAG1893831.1 hypothetical protein F5891DRAFT_985467 [Suillus fuscotomentosus]